MLLTYERKRKFMLSENEFQALFHSLSIENRQYITDLVDCFQADALNFQRAPVVQDLTVNNEHTA